MLKTLKTITLSAALMCLTAFAHAQSTNNRVAVNSDWSVYEESSPKECWAVSAPKESVNTRDGTVVAVRRGEILLYVFYRPAENVSGQVVFTSGYPFASNSEVTMNIDGTVFRMFTDGEHAWPENAAADAQIVAAMKRGASAVLTARSSRGTQTQDTFSLIGFTASVSDALKRCS